MATSGDRRGSWPPAAAPARTVIANTIVMAKTVTPAPAIRTHRPGRRRNAFRDADIDCLQQGTVAANRNDNSREEVSHYYPPSGNRKQNQASRFLLRESPCKQTRRCSIGSAPAHQRAASLSEPFEQIGTGETLAARVRQTIVLPENHD